MLTGDNPFTAVNIAHSCGLIEKTQTTYIISQNNHDSIKEKLEEIKKHINKNNNNREKSDFCLVITGDTLTAIQKDVNFQVKKPQSSKSVISDIDNNSINKSTINDSDFQGEKKNIKEKSDETLLSLFEQVCLATNTVICSRVSPKQKADLILMVKKFESENITTLAIGDGANDVNMINVADVGIGIMGNEGQQAARASDYVIGQFSFLRRLLFVHGREAHRKNAFAIGYILWKNFLYVVPIIL